MQLYFNCNYAGSPAGFNVGKLILDRTTTGTVALSGENIDPLILNCFDYGTVRKACGILQQKPRKYFLLAKKLTAQGKEPGEPEHYSLNIALVTNNVEQFRSWWREGDCPAQEIAEIIKNSMELDRTNDFGFRVRAEQAAFLAEKSFKSLLAGCDPRSAESEICVETAYTQTDLEKLAKDLQLSESDKAFQKSGSGKWVIYRKKKRTLRNLIAAALVLAILIKGVLWLISFLKG